MDEPLIGPTRRVDPRVIGSAAAFLAGSAYGYLTAWASDPERFQGQSSPAMSGFAIVALATVFGCVLLVAIGVMARRRFRSWAIAIVAPLLAVLGFVAGVYIVLDSRPDGPPRERPGTAVVESMPGRQRLWAGPVTCEGVGEVTLVDGLAAPVTGGDSLDAEIASRDIDFPDGLLDRVLVTGVYMQLGDPHPGVWIADANTKPDRWGIGFQAQSLGIAPDGWTGHVAFSQLEPDIVITWACQADTDR